MIERNSIAFDVHPPTRERIERIMPNLSPQEHRERISDELRRIADELRTEWKKLPALSPKAKINRRLRRDKFLIKDAARAGRLIIEAYDLAGFANNDDFLKEVVEDWRNFPDKIFSGLIFPRRELREGKPAGNLLPNWLSCQCPDFIPDNRNKMRGYNYANAMEKLANMIYPKSEKQTKITSVNRNKNEVGCPRKWKNLWEVIQEQDKIVPRPGNKKIAGIYNQRNSRGPKADANKVSAVRCRYSK
jgi:hypothetical protein